MLSKKNQVYERIWLHLALPGSQLCSAKNDGFLLAQQIHPFSLNSRHKMLHGLQIWVALPKDLEQMEPEFCHVEGADIPSWTQDGVSFKLIAGEAFGYKLCTVRYIF